MLQRVFTRSRGAQMNREDTRKKLVELIEPLIKSKGFELIDLDYYSGRQGKVFICIDAEGGVKIEDCEEISKAVSGLLDLHDPLPHAYLLEVSSPGPERPLSKIEHFMRFVGAMVKISTKDTILGKSKFAGKLKKANPDFITVECVDGLESNIPYGLIKKAHLWYIKPETNKKRS
jgi:ribosome maturation factor RimP